MHEIKVLNYVFNSTFILSIVTLDKFQVSLLANKIHHVSPAQLESFKTWNKFGGNRLMRRQLNHEIRTAP